MKKLRIIALSSQKGGSGKTTVAMQLAAGLAERGEDVLIVDLDSQQSALHWIAAAAPDSALPARVIGANGSRDQILRQAQAWEARKLAAVERLLDPRERASLAGLAHLCRAKRAVDVQYALQTLLRRWTYLHAPAAAAFLVMAAWHSMAAFVYSR